MTVTPPPRWRDVLGLYGIRPKPLRRLWRWLIEPLTR